MLRFNSMVFSFAAGVFLVLALGHTRGGGTGTALVMAFFACLLLATISAIADDAQS